METQRIYYLLERELEAALSPEEEAELAALKLAADNDALVKAMAVLMAREASASVMIDAAAEDAAFRKIVKVDKRPVRKMAWLRYAAAAAVLLVCTVYYFQLKQQRAQQEIAEIHIPPGSGKATLTLADGNVIPLDSAGTKVIGQGITQRGEMLEYTASASASINTLTTPRGGQFQLKLPDGSKVWLNAASALKYPTVFKKERVVEVSGEAYFEIAPHADMPFSVMVNGSKVEVLGTAFNINAYPDESGVRTTLVEGAVRVKDLVLSPGQQAHLANGKTVLVPGADIAQATAWKNGLFNFYKMDIPAVMRQLSRWYNVDVVYEGKMPERQFWGALERQLSLEQVLEFLRETGVHCRIEGRKLIVSGQEK